MLVNSNIVDEYRQLLSLGRTLNQPFACFTLGGLLDYASAILTEPKIQRAKLADNASFLVGEAEKANSRLWLPTGPEKFAAHPLEIYSLQDDNSFTGQEWTLFCGRCRRSLVEISGLSGSLASALSGLLSELGDNVICHSKASPGSNVSALAGYHVANGYFSLGVSDVGCGIRQSLVRNPHWRHLSNEMEAIDAVVKKRASSRVNQDFGDGYDLIIRSIADMNGSVRIRSGNARFEFHPLGEQRRLTTCNVAQAHGVHSLITWHRSPGSVGEIAIEFV